MPSNKLSRRQLGIGNYEMSYPGIIGSPIAR